MIANDRPAERSAALGYGRPVRSFINATAEQRRSMMLTGCLILGAALGLAAVRASTTGAVAATTCGTPYTFEAAGRTILSGSCAGQLGPGTPLLRIRVGGRFSVRILHEQDGRLDFPVPTPSNRAIRLLNRRGSTAFYSARSRGLTTLVSRHTRYCARINPRYGTCPALKVQVVGSAG